MCAVDCSLGVRGWLPDIKKIPITEKEYAENADKAMNLILVCIKFQANQAHSQTNLRHINNLTYVYLQLGRAFRRHTVKS